MTIAYTLVNIAYLPMAKTLADSFRKIHPEVPFYICLFEDQNHIKDNLFLPYEIYDKNKLNQTEFEEMRSRYDDMSMACALKPFFAEALIRDFSPSNLIYIDADTKLYSSMHYVISVLETKASIVLTGHLYSIIENEDELNSNTEIRKYGLFNAGFIAIKNDSNGKAFLSWWKRILYKKCIRDDKNGIYYDQTWLDLVPFYFNESTFILKDLGYNVAYWNLKERKISIEHGQYFVNNKIPLVFYHFARYKNKLPSEAKMQNPEYLSENEKLVINYHKELLNNKFVEYTSKIFRKKNFMQRLRLSLKYRLGILLDKL